MNKHNITTNKINEILAEFISLAKFNLMSNRVAMAFDINMQLCARAPRFQVVLVSNRQRGSAAYYTDLCIAIIIPRGCGLEINFDDFIDS